MGRYLILLSLLVGLSLHVQAQPAQGAGAANVESDYQDFLVRMGFQDFSKQADQTLNSKKDLHPVQARILKFNRDRYEVVNAARDLSAFIMARALENNSNELPQVMDRLAELTSRALVLQPLSVPDEFPEELENIKSEKARDEAKQKWLDQNIRDLLEKSERQLVSDIMTSLHGEEGVRARISGHDQNFQKELQFVQSHVETYMQLVYSDPELAQTKFLGRALAASVVRHARLQKDLALEQKVASRSLDKGAILGNFISDELIFPGKDKKVTKMKVGQGDFIMEYSSGKVAWSVSSAIIPGGFISRVKAFMANLYGNLILAPFILDEDSLLKKVERGDKRTLREHIAYYLMQRPIARRGYSHAGLAQVNRDKETGLAMTWARDLYPNEDLGGIRFIGIEGFAHDGTYQRFGIAKYDPEKFLRWAQDQSHRRGWKEVVWNTRPLKDGKEPKAEADKKTVELKANISQDDFKKLVDRPMSEAPQFVQEVGDRVIHQMDQFMVGSQALGFAQAQNMEHFASCTQAMALAFLQGTDLDPQIEHDRWANPVKIAKALDLKDTTQVSPLEDRVIAPGGFAWQSKLVKEHISVDFEDRTPVGRYLLRFQPERADMNRNVTDLLRPSFDLDASKVNLNAEVRVAHDYLAWQHGSDSLGGSEKSKLTALSENLNRRYEAPLSVNSTPMKRDYVELENSLSTKADQRIMREFLINLGFEDYVSVMKKNLAEGKALGPMAERQLKRNIDNYEVFNASRELSILIMSQMQNRLENANDRRDLIELTARLLAVKPMNPPREYPQEIMRLAEPQKTKAIEAFLWTQRKIQMEEHARRIVSDMADLIYGQERVAAIADGLAKGNPEAIRLQTQIGRLHSLVAVNIRSLYLDTQIGRTAFIGRALTALIARHGQLTKDKSLIADLSSEVDKHGLKIQNYLGDTFKIYDEKVGGWVSRKMDNMNFLLIKNHTAETAMISRGAIPADYKLAKKLGLVGNLAYALFVPTVDEEIKNMSMLNRFRDNLTQLPKLRINDGYSHAGFARVNEDKSTGLKMTWVVDNYPEPAADASDNIGLTSSTGGVRIGGYEHYDDTTHYIRFLAASHNKLAYFKFAIEYIRQHGYPKDGIVFPSVKPEFNDKQELIVPKNPIAQDWKIEISPEEFREIHREIFNGDYIGKSEAELTVIAERWHDRVMKKASDQMVNLGEKGLYFQWITPLGQYYYGGGYCSETGELALRMATGMTFQEKPDRFIGLVKMVSKWSESPTKRKWLVKLIGEQHVNDLVAMDHLNPGIFTPSGLVAQSFVGEVTEFDHPARRVDEREKSQRRPFTERNREVTKLLEKVLPRSEERFNQFSHHQIAEVYKSTYAEADRDYAGATNAQKGVKTEVREWPEILKLQLAPKGSKVRCAEIFNAG